jgi:hypothetical protein
MDSSTQRCGAVLVAVLVAVMATGCGNSSKPTSGQANVTQAAQLKLNRTYQEVKDAEEHIYPGQPLLGCACLQQSGADGQQRCSANGSPSTMTPSVS